MSVPTYEEWKAQVAKWEAEHPDAPTRTCPGCGFTSARWSRHCETCNVESANRIVRVLGICQELHPGRTSGSIEEMIVAFAIDEERQSKVNPS